MSRIDGLAASMESIVAGAVGLTSRALVEAVPDEELTMPQWRAIVIVGSSADGVRVGKVAERIGATAPATGRLLRRLSQRGLISLTPDEADRRATIARLTRRGVQTREAIVRHRQRALRTLARDILADEHEQLDRVAAAIAHAFARYA